MCDRDDYRHFKSHGNTDTRSYEVSRGLASRDLVVLLTWPYSEENLPQ